MPVDNPERQHAYNTIADRDKADQCESEGVEPARLDQLDKQQEQNFYDFAQHKVPTNLQNAFTDVSRIVHMQDLPSGPVSYPEFKGYLFEEQFCADIEIHKQQHKKQFKSWKLVSSANAKGHQVIGCQWVFKSKTDKHDRLQKCKAR